MHSFSMRENNFDLLRLIAATQVLIGHGVEHLELDVGWLHHLLVIFPGVPIFFVISGFLISASYERNSDLTQYAQNRALRIFPALWTCLAASIVMASVIGGVTFPVAQAIPWVAAQASIVQFYNPDFLRGFGTGVLNGSLWTISIELQFYIVLPLIYFVIGENQRDKKLLIGAVIFAFAHMAIFAVTAGESSVMLRKLAGVLLPTHLYLFLVGILLQRNYLTVRRFIEGKGLAWIAGYTALALAATLAGFSETSNRLNPVLAIILGIAAVSLATTAPKISRALLGGNDISYGIYIYHIPIINCLMHVGIMRSGESLFLAAVLTIAAAVASWRFVERPFLRMKRNPLHPISG